MRAKRESRLGARAVRLLAGLLALAIALEIVYLVGANGFLRSPWGRDVLNRKPEKLTVGWESAWTWLPGVVHFTHLELEGRARRADWRTAMDSGRMLVYLPSLLGRHFRVIHGLATGAEVEITVHEAPQVPRPPRRQRPWRVTLGGLEVEPLRLFRLNEQEIRGSGRAAGWARFEVRGPLEFDLASLAFEDALVVDQQEVVAETLQLTGALAIDPFLVGDDSIEDLLAGATGTIALDTQASSLGFLSSYLDRVPWLRLGGSGHLTADLEVTNGWMAPGSVLSLEGPRLGADLFGLRASGEGTLRGLVPEGAGHTELSVTLPAYSVSREADGARLLDGAGLEVVIVNDSAAIDRPAEGIRLTVDVPPARIPNLAAFSSYLPEATGLELKGGSGEFAARLTYRASEESGEGWLRVAGQGVEAAFGEVDMSADVVLDGRLADARLEDGRFDLSGTRLEIDEVVTSERGRVRDRGWWGRIRTSSGSLVKALGDPDAPPALIEAELAAELRDTGPLVALLEQHLPKLSWIDGLLTVHGVTGSADVRVLGSAISLGDLQVTGGKKSRLEMRGDLDLAEADPRGVLFARWGRLSAAVSLAEGERDWKLTRSRRWFERNLTEYRALRGAER